MRPSVPRPAVALLACFTLAAALLAGMAFAAKPGGSAKPVSQAAPGTVNAPPKTSAASAPPAAPMGHADFKMVSRYAHLSPEHMRKAVQGLEASMISKAKTEEPGRAKVVGINERR